MTNSNCKEFNSSWGGLKILGGFLEGPDEPVVPPAFGARLASFTFPSFKAEINSLASLFLPVWTQIYDMIVLAWSNVHLINCHHLHLPAQLIVPAFLVNSRTLPWPTRYWTAIIRGLQFDHRGGWLGSVRLLRQETACLRHTCKHESRCVEEYLNNNLPPRSQSPSIRMAEAGEGSEERGMSSWESCSCNISVGKFDFYDKNVLLTRVARDWKQQE